jgi:hypothetical protein
VTAACPTLRTYVTSHRAAREAPGKASKKPDEVTLARQNFAWVVTKPDDQACVASRKLTGAGKRVDRGRHPGDRGPMDLTEAAQAWNEDGFVVLPGFIAAEDLKPAVDELSLMFPSADGFHDGTDPRRERFLGDEFAGIDEFPFASAELSLLAASPCLLDLAEALLGEADVQIYGAEAWAKYTGAADYDQDMHRDYLGHTMLVPCTAPGFRQLEMIVFLVDVPEELGPTHLVPPASTCPTGPPSPTGSGGRASASPVTTSAALPTRAAARSSTRRRCPPPGRPGQPSPSRSALSTAGHSSQRRAAPATTCT